MERKRRLERAKRDLPMKWTPSPGLYKSVMPAGTIHISLYVDGRTAEPYTVLPGEEVELYEREIRELKKSSILLYGYLAPVIHYDKNEETGDWEDNGRGATEDPHNPNVISDDYIHVKIQLFDSLEEFSDYIDKIDSYITLHRYRQACIDLDTPSSWIHAIDDRKEHLDKLELQQMGSGIVTEERRKFLTPKLGD